MNRRTAGTWRQRTLHGIVLLVALVLCVRLIDLQVLRHEYFRDKAERQWKHRERLAPLRGNLYDRSGRPLALSVTKYRVGVSANKQCDTTPLAERLATILKIDAGALARRLRAEQGKHVVLTVTTALSSRDLNELRGLAPVTVERLLSRTYPLGGVGASLIGFHRDDGQDGAIATGLEQSLGSHLGGSPGEAWRLETAKPGESLGRVVLEPPVHGRNLVLTLDADLQAIAEDQLARAIDTHGASGGTVLIADPRQGDILAAASSPLIQDRAKEGGEPAVWNNFNFTGLYEPGSVFKIFTAAALLRNGAVDTSTAYDCDDGDFGRFRIHNSEDDEYGQLSLMPALTHSVNIYLARASVNLEAAELYRDLMEFGFGQRTRFPYPAQPAGILKHPSHWSGRSKATIAIGQEVAVTPLQLVMATCAIANGGHLFAPRIVREVRDHQNRLLEECTPTTLHRVVSEPLARLLRVAMGRVVAEGTGRAACLPWVDVGGKTGTAQKSLDGRTYAPGCYMASFVGIVPVTQPRLVILTLLDEPRWGHHYAAQSAVPLFADIVSDIRRSTSWLTAVAGKKGGEVVDVPHQERAVVPDVLYLEAATAVEELRRAGFNMSGGDRGGVIVAQVPSPGALMPEGTQVTVTIAAPQPPRAGAKTLCPDLQGYSHRQVRQIASVLGVPVSVVGSGYVAEQQPRAGSVLSEQGIHVRMVSTWR